MSNEELIKRICLEHLTRDPIWNAQLLSIANGLGQPTAAMSSEDSPSWMHTLVHLCRGRRPRVTINYATNSLKVFP